ncbi:uncharacterized protein LOC144435195 [Glandiceps talaboti]
MARILLIFLLFALIAAISAVSVDPAALMPMHAESDDTLDELEHAIFVDVAHVEKVERTFTPKKCCKVGRRVASKKLFCNIDLFQVEKKDNTVQKEKMKFHGPAAVFETTYKNLMMRVEKCYPSKASRSMFSKCCEWQAEIERNLESCKKLTDREERRECRRRVKSRER